MLKDELKDKLMLHNTDALLLEKWLEKQHGDIIVLWDKFQKHTGWNKDRLNSAAHYLWLHSDKVGW